MNTKSYQSIDTHTKDNIFIRFLYNTIIGRIILIFLVNPLVSKLVGFFMNCRISKLLIPHFIKMNNISLTEYENIKHHTFNSFFTRQIKAKYRPISTNKNDVIAPCDGKLTAYRVREDSTFKIKHSKYDVSSLLQDKSLANEYKNGVCLIFRLTPDDYHRYCYIDSGKTIKVRKIKGILHTVRPIAVQKYKVYIENSREYAILQTENFGEIIQMEVGALLIGRIKNDKTIKKFTRGTEKGMFEFGGSTIIMLFKNNVIEIDNIIYENTNNNKETIIKMGNKIGKKVH